MPFTGGYIPSVIPVLFCTNFIVNQTADPTGGTPKRAMYGADTITPPPEVELEAIANTFKYLVGSVILASIGGVMYITRPDMV